MHSPSASRRRFLRFLSASPLTLFASTNGCQTTAANHPQLRRYTGESLTITISFPSTLTGTQLQWVMDALPDAERRLDAHGLTLPQGALIQVHPTVRAFVQATGQSTHWLRAWSTFATIHLLTPDHWGNQSSHAKVERLTHELVHCAIYQSFQSRRNASVARIPFWFQEGTASVVARQGYRRLPLGDVMRSASRDNLLFKSYRGQVSNRAAYGAAHHAAALLNETYGAHIFRKILQTAQANPNGPQTIEKALRNETGLDRDQIWNLLKQKV